MKNLFRWMLSVIGYGAYTVGVLVVLLWVLFPAEKVRAWLENRLEEQSRFVSWKIDDLHIAWPLSIVGKDIRGLKKSDGEQLVLVDELKVRPDLTQIGGLKDHWPVSYRAKILGGSVTGKASFVKNTGKVKCVGELQDAQLAGLEEIWKQLGRKGSGVLSSSFSCEGDPAELLSGDVKADLTIDKGSFELLQPVFGLDSLDFNRMSTTLSLSERVAVLERGKVDSDLFALDFAGTVTLADDLPGSGLDIKGSFEPRPELLGNLKNPAIIQLIREQLSENKLMYTLTDTVQQPGIVFQGVSGVIDGIIQGSIR